MSDLYTADDEARLKAILDHAYADVLRTMHLLVADHLGLDPADFRLDDSATRAMLDAAGQRVVGIGETTRQALAALLADGQAAGLTTRELADSIAHLFAVTWAGRADTIARTEIGTAQLLAAADRYRASGLVDRVTIRDGDQDEPCASQNGTTVPLGQEGGLNHPNCSKIIVPLLREGV